MDQIIESILVIIIVLAGFQMLLFSIGASKTHPMTFIGKVLGGLLVGVLRLPFILIGGVASGVFRRKGRKRRRLN